MGVYIKGMEMPTSCYDCILDNYKFFKRLECRKHVTGDMIKDGIRSPSCPLVPVPEHGQMTNADRIRAMTDEEFAKWIWREATLGYLAICPPGTKDGACPTSDCDSCWLGWLASPVDKEAEK